MPASPRLRARCKRHEARAGIVALQSCCLVQPSNGGLGPPGETAHYLRARGVPFAVVPHWRAAWTRCLSVVISEATAKPCFSSAERNRMGLRTSRFRVDDHKRYHLRCSGRAVCMRTHCPALSNESFPWDVVSSSGSLLLILLSYSLSLTLFFISIVLSHLTGRTTHG